MTDSAQAVPQLEEHIIISIPPGWADTLLHALCIAEMHAAQHAALLKQLGVTKLDPVGESRMLREHVEQQVRRQTRLKS